MDPLLVFDCQKIIPNRFELVLAAAARARALHQGAEPRLTADGMFGDDLALREIASNAFTPDEIAPFTLTASHSNRRLFKETTRSGPVRGDGPVAPSPQPPSCRRRSIDH